jgi:hypothetical protein
MFLFRRKGNRRRGLLRRAASTRVGRRTLRRLPLLLVLRTGRRLGPGAAAVIGARYFFDRTSGSARRKDAVQRIGGVVGRTGLGSRKEE